MSKNPFKSEFSIPVSEQLKKEEIKEISSIPLEPLVRVGYEVPKSIRKQINEMANDLEIDKKDIAHALLDYALTNKGKIDFFSYKK